MSHVLIVRIPVQEVSDGRKFREYIIESLREGVVVLTDDVACEVMELPTLGGVVIEQMERENGDNSAEAPPVEAAGMSEGEEKRLVLQRLKAYRETHGLGCLKAVAGKTRSKGRINDNALRMILTGDATPMPIEDWRLIGRALDRLEQQEEQET